MRSGTENIVFSVVILYEILRCHPQRVFRIGQPAVNYSCSLLLYQCVGTCVELGLFILLCSLRQCYSMCWSTNCSGAWSNKEFAPACKWMHGLPLLRMSGSETALQINSMPMTSWASIRTQGSYFLVGLTRRLQTSCSVRGTARRSFTPMT